jgi:hypothetical protein
MKALGVDEAEHDPQREEDREQAEVAMHGAEVRVDLAAAFPTAPEGHRRQPDEEHRDRAEHEGGADDRSDGHVLALGAGEQRHHRDQRLGQGGAHRGEQAADRPLAEVQAVAEPLDAVREQQRATDDQDEAGE